MELPREGFTQVLAMLQKCTVSLFQKTHCVSHNLLAVRSCFNEMLVMFFQRQSEKHSTNLNYDCFLAHATMPRRTARSASAAAASSAATTTRRAHFQDPSAPDTPSAPGSGPQSGRVQPTHSESAAGQRPGTKRRARSGGSNADGEENATRTRARARLSGLRVGTAISTAPIPPTPAGPRPEDPRMGALSAAVDPFDGAPGLHPASSQRRHVVRRSFSKSLCRSLP